jgi:3-hydroxyisobutyrate dehydrogenase-like beta-hydroxyacid dehydrogenase
MSESSSSGPSDDQSRAPVGWIGIGKMGTPMSHRLLSAGFPLQAFDVDVERVRSAGLIAARSLPELVHSVQIVVTMIPDDNALEQLILGPAGLATELQRGQILMDMSTVSAFVSQRCAARLNEMGVGFVRAPVSGSTALAAAGKLTIMSSGPQDAIARCRPLFSAMGEKCFIVGEADEARYLKLLINLMVGASAAMLAEALVFGEKGGLDWSVMLDVVGQSVVASPLIGYKLEPLKKRDFSPAFSGKQMLKDMTLVTKTAEGSGLNLPLTELVRQTFQSMQESGHSDLDFFALVKVLEEKLL